MKNAQTLKLRKLMSIPLFIGLLARKFALEKPNSTSQVILGRIVKVHRKYQSIRSLFVVQFSNPVNFSINKVFILRKNGIGLGTNAKTLLYD